MQASYKEKVICNNIDDDKVEIIVVAGSRLLICSINSVYDNKLQTEGFPQCAFISFADFQLIHFKDHYQ